MASNTALNLIGSPGFVESLMCQNGTQRAKFAIIVHFVTVA